MKNRYQKTIVLLLSCLNASAMQQPRRWKGRAIPVTFDQNIWKVLVGHSIKDPKNVFTDFSKDSLPPQKGIKSKKGNVIASEALKEQTNGVYTVAITGDMPYYQSPAGDWLHFVPVEFKSGNYLYHNARNSSKDDFMWIPVDTIINGQTIKHQRYDKISDSIIVTEITISPGVYNFLKKNLARAIASISSQPSQSSLMLAQQLPPAPRHPPIIGPESCPQSAPTPLAPAPAAPSAYATMPLPPLPAHAVSKPRVPSLWGPHLPNHIYFYQSGKPYYEFTNFYPAQVTIDGKVWPTTEHYFQAQKFAGYPHIQEMVRKLRTPREAFNMTRDAQYNQYKVNQKQWDDSLRFEAMTNAVRAKFNQHANLKNILIGTGDAILVEDAGAHDAIWGAGADYRGQNHLGRILMHIRDELTGKISHGTSYQP